MKPAKQWAREADEIGKPPQKIRELKLGADLGTQSELLRSWIWRHACKSEYANQSATRETREPDLSRSKVCLYFHPPRMKMAGKLALESLYGRH